MSGIKGMNIGNTNGFVKGMVSLNRGKTKVSGLYLENCGFQVGHKSFSYVGMNKEQIHIKTAIWLKFKCLECGEEFKIREHSMGRGRGKYCSRKCFTKAKTIYELAPDKRFLHQLRQLDEYKKWRMDCLKRDWFRCQECFIKDNLEVHHIKSFTELSIEFLQEYNQFSPIEDKETLYRLATKSKSLWDINNGQTLCETHHKSLTLRIRYEMVV